MNTYYLYHTKNHIILPLGEVSFNKFYVEDGWYIFTAMVDNDDSSINNYIVRRDDSKDILSIEQFLDEIKKYEIKLDK